MNLIVVVFWYMLGGKSLSEIIVLDVFFIGLTVINSKSEVLRELINFSVRSSQGLLFSSFNPIKFTPKVFSDIPKVF